MSRKKKRKILMTTTEPLLQSPQQPEEDRNVHLFYKDMAVSELERLMDQLEAAFNEYWDAETADGPIVNRDAAKKRYVSLRMQYYKLKHRLEL